MVSVSTMSYTWLSLKERNIKFKLMNYYGYGNLGTRFTAKATKNPFKLPQIATS